MKGRWFGAKPRDGEPQARCPQRSYSGDSSSSGRRQLPGDLQREVCADETRNRRFHQHGATALRVWISEFPARKGESGTFNFYSEVCSYPVDSTRALNQRSDCPLLVFRIRYWYFRFLRCSFSVNRERSCYERCTFATDRSVEYRFGVARHAKRFHKSVAVET